MVLSLVELFAEQKFQVARVAIWHSEKLPEKRETEKNKEIKKRTEGISRIENQDILTNQSPQGQSMYKHRMEDSLHLHSLDQNKLHQHPHEFSQ